MADQYQKPYLDSSVFIAWLKGEEVKGVSRQEVADHILTQAENGQFKIHTSAITLAEVHKLRTGPKLSSEEDDRILAYFEHDFILTSTRTALSVRRRTRFVVSTESCLTTASTLHAR